MALVGRAMMRRMAGRGAADHSVESWNLVEISRFAVYCSAVTAQLGPLGLPAQSEVDA
jgi:hypothetical protein